MNEEHITELHNGAIEVGKRPAEQRQEKCDQLRESVNWEDAPAWARLLHLEIEQLMDE